MNIVIYDYGDTVIDRYTVVYLDDKYPNGLYGCRGMSYNPFSGFGMYSECENGPHLGKVITFDQLPPDCQSLVKQDLK